MLFCMRFTQFSVADGLLQILFTRNNCQQDLPAAIEYEDSASSTKTKIMPRPFPSMAMEIVKSGRSTLRRRYTLNFCCGDPARLTVRGLYLQPRVAIAQHGEGLAFGQRFVGDGWEIVTRRLAEDRGLCRHNSMVPSGVGTVFEVRQGGACQQ